MGGDSDWKSSLMRKWDWNSSHRISRARGKRRRKVVKVEDEQVVHEVKLEEKVEEVVGEKKDQEVVGEYGDRLTMCD